MAGLIGAHAGQGSLLPVRPPSSAARWSPPASQVAVRVASPLLRSAKVCSSRPLPVAALGVSKDGGSAVLASRQPSKGCSFSLFEAFRRCLRYRTADQCQ
jgi:hypothetical protein